MLAFLLEKIEKQKEPKRTDTNKLCHIFFKAFEA